MSHHTHRFVFRIAGFHWCARCGLIALGNRATRREMERPCPGRDDDE